MISWNKPFQKSSPAAAILWPISLPKTFSKACELAPVTCRGIKNDERFLGASETQKIVFESFSSTLSGPKSFQGF